MRSRDEEPRQRARRSAGIVPRRAVLHALAAGIAGVALPPAARIGVAAGVVTAQPVAQGLTLLAGAGGNVLVLATTAGKVLVDAGAAELNDVLVRTLEELPGGAVAALFNTHWHLDQIGANEALGAAGAAIYAHEKTRQRLSTGYYLPAEDRYQPALAPAGRPVHGFHTEDTTTIGERRIEYGYLIEAHTDGDIYVRFPDINVVAVGDVVSPLRDPAFDWFGGGWLGGRVDALARLLELGDERTRYVPSYGPVVGRAEVEAERDMLLMLFERMVEHVRLGESAADMLTTGVLDGLGRTFEDPAQLLYDLHKGFWAHHNKLTHDIV
jgi:glyoxylase-like metal-dependent hydrolase (beta-lactamase superfamily II)